MWEDKRAWTFFCVFIDYGLMARTYGQKQWLKVMEDCITNTRFLVHKTLIGELESCQLLVDYCDFFINSHSQGTHALQRIQLVSKWSNFSKVVQIKKKTHFGWPQSEYVFSKFSFWGEIFLYVSRTALSAFVLLQDLYCNWRTTLNHSFLCSRNSTCLLKGHVAEA